MRNFAAVSLIGTCLLSAGVVHSSFSSPFQKSTLPKGNQHQVPLAMSGSDPGRPSHQLLSDVLGRDRSISVFAGLVRDVATVTGRLQDSSANVTILAPLNSELSKLQMKPWQKSEDYRVFGTSAYEGDEGQSRAQENLRKFVEGHIVLQRPMKKGSDVSTMSGTSVRLEERDGKQVISPGAIEVETVADKVANGEVWIIRGVLQGLPPNAAHAS